jgi:signal transduction histidine kinase
MGSAQQAKRLCDILLEQGPGCVWALRQDLSVHCIWGDAALLFGADAAGLAGRNLQDILLPESRQSWRDRVARVFLGETVSWREGSLAVTCFPVREGSEIVHAGGTALETAALDAAEERLRQAAAEGRERERGRLARILHDDVGPSIGAAGLQLELLRMDLERLAPEMRDRAAEAQQALERAMERVRELANEMNPAPMDGAGLRAALDRMVARARREFPGDLRLAADSSLRLEAPVAAAFYRIAEQAVEDAMRHARPALIEVRLASTAGGPVLEVRDDGGGFDDEGRGPGLAVMEHCAAGAGLELAVASRQGGGAIVRAAAPAAAAAASD